MQATKRLWVNISRSPKNAMVADIYEKLGFTPNGDNTFTADTDSFKFNKTHIQKGDI